METGARRGVQFHFCIKYQIKTGIHWHLFCSLADAYDMHCRLSYWSKGFSLYPENNSSFPSIPIPPE